MIDPLETLRLADQEIARATQLLADVADRKITITAAARRLDCCGETVRRWVKTGKLAGWRYPSGQYRVSSAAVEKLLSTPLNTSPHSNG